MKVIKIKTEYITLGQFLKLINLINSGGEAKFYLHMNDVFVNGVKEDRRGKKIYSDYIVKINNTEYLVKPNDS